MRPKNKVTIKVTHKAIRARYEAAKQNDPSFSFTLMGLMFGVDRGQAYRWTRVILDEQGNEIQDHRNSLPSGTRKKKVSAWINDGVLSTILRTKGKKVEPDSNQPNKETKE